MEIQCIEGCHHVVGSRHVGELGVSFCFGDLAYKKTNMGTRHDSSFFSKSQIGM